MQTLISSAAIEQRVVEMGRQLTADYEDRSLTVIGVLSGSVIFLADLVRRIERPQQIGFVQASSYRGETTEAGTLTLMLDGLPDVRGRDVLMIDDIFDTGRTLAALQREIQSREPASLKTAVLLWKTARQTVAQGPDYWGFQIPDAFVVGYGLDYAGDYRHLPEIAVLPSEN